MKLVDTIAARAPGFYREHIRSSHKSHAHTKLERTVGFEPTLSDLEARVLPFELRPLKYISGLLDAP